MDTLLWTTTIPASLVAGEYLIRHELIAVHQANNPQCMYFSSSPYSYSSSIFYSFHLPSRRKPTNKTIVYPECAQLVVTGSGTASPPSSALVSFPGAYSASDPGINFNIDSADAMKATTYQVPGPAVWNGSGSATPSEPAPSASAIPTTLVTSAVATPTTPPASCSVAKFGQCGGKTYVINSPISRF